MTIDELARRTGMTVRNLRAHQSRGLLPPPEVRGRTGYYGPGHVARVELVKELQAEGFNLEAIRRLIENAGGSTSEVLRFTRAARETFEGEEAARAVFERAGAELARLGIPADRARDVLEALRRHADGVAHTYVALFLDQVWRPFDEAGRPPERWPAVMEALERLRPLATESLVAMFGLVMTDAVDEAIGEELRRESAAAGRGRAA